VETGWGSILDYEKNLFSTIRLSAAHCIFACFFTERAACLADVQSDISHFVDFNIFLKSGS